MWRLTQSTMNLQDLANDSKLNSSRVSKMICLPSIARHEGIALLCCGDDADDNKAFLVVLFNSMGGVVVLDTERELETAMVTTCTMGPLYGTMKNQRDWLLASIPSLSTGDATRLVIRQFEGAILDLSAKAAVADENDKHNESSSEYERIIETLIEEQTPGGLNEQALRNYEVLGGMEDQRKVMRAIVSRIRGESDGKFE